MTLSEQFVARRVERIYVARTVLRVVDPPWRFRQVDQDLAIIELGPWARIRMTGGLDHLILATLEIQADDVICHLRGTLYDCRSYLVCPPVVRCVTPLVVVNHDVGDAAVVAVDTVPQVLASDELHRQEGSGPLWIARHHLCPEPVPWGVFDAMIRLGGN